MSDEMNNSFGNISDDDNAQQNKKSNVNYFQK